VDFFTLKYAMLLVTRVTDMLYLPIFIFVSYAYKRRLPSLRLLRNQLLHSYLKSQFIKNGK